MKKLARNSLALGTATLIVTAGLSFAANGADATKSYSTGRFLSGSIGSTNLDNLAQLKGVTAANPGNAGPNTNPLSLTLLSAIPINLPGGLNLNLADFLSPGNGSAGVANQFADAQSTGKARGASGAVNDTGAVLAPGNGQFPSDAKISLSGGLLDSVNSELAGVDLNVGALSSSTIVDKNGPTRDYQIAGLGLDVEVPLLKTLLGSLDTAIDGLDAIDDLTIPPSGTDVCNLVGGTLDITTATLLGTLEDVGLGALGEAVQDALDVLGVSSVNACNLPPGLGLVLNGGDLDTLLEGLVSVNITGLGGVTNGLGGVIGGDGAALDLSNGVISIDLEAILDNANVELNNLPPNTDVLQYLTSGLIQDKIAAVLDTAVNDIIAKVGDVEVTITVGGNPLPAAQLDPLVAPVVDILNTVTTGLTDALAPVDDLLADLVPDLAQIVKLTANNQSTSKTPTLSEGTVGTGSIGTAAVGDYYRTSALKIDLLSNVANVDLAASEAAVLAADVVDDDDSGQAAAAADDADAPADNDADADSSDADSAADADADANADTVADADAQADADVTTTLPSAGAPNLLPFWLLGIALLLFGAAVLVNEKRRLSQI